jgi:hypothetical protein
MICADISPLPLLPPTEMRRWTIEVSTTLSGAQLLVLVSSKETISM